MRQSGWQWWAPVLAAGLLSGCALSPVPPATLVPPPCRPHPLALLALRPAVRDKSLQRVFSLPPKPPPEAARLDALRGQISLRATRALAQALAGVALSAEPLAAVPALPDLATGRPLAPEQLQVLQAQQPASAYLLLQVTDYGETPRHWMAAYVSFEVVTTLAIGAVLYAVEDSGKLAGVYLLQETVEEVGEGYTGFWVLNRTMRPVRIEAALIDGRSGQLLWQGHRTGLAPWRWQHLRHMDATTQNTLLGVALQRAVEHLAADLAAHLAGACRESRENAG